MAAAFVELTVIATRHYTLNFPIIFNLISTHFIRDILVMPIIIGISGGLVQISQTLVPSLRIESHYLLLVLFSIINQIIFPFNFLIQILQNFLLFFACSMASARVRFHELNRLSRGHFPILLIFNMNLWKS